MRFFSVPHPLLVSYAVAGVVLLVLWLVYRIGSGTWNPLVLIEGADGRPSSSKFQFFVWTVVIAWCYVVLYYVRWRYVGEPSAVTILPTNLLIAMGLSVTTAVAAKGITVSYVAAGKVTKARNKGGIGDLFTDDSGAPDLSKMQMLAWTFITLGVYVMTLRHHLELAVTTPLLARAAPEKFLAFPDMDGSLMVLMGLSQGGYLGYKLTTTGTPRLVSLNPVCGTPPILATLGGSGFGETTGAGLVTVNGNPVTPIMWKDDIVQFEVPRADPAGHPWMKGQVILVGVIARGQPSVNMLPFSIA